MLLKNNIGYVEHNIGHDNKSNKTRFTTRLKKGLEASK